MTLTDIKDTVLTHEKRVSTNLSGNHTDTTFYKIIHTLSEGGSSVVCVVLITMFQILSPKTFPIIIALSTYIFQVAIVEIIKKAVKRKRPSEIKKKSIFGFRASSGSFPSGHTSNSISIAIIASTLFSPTPYTMILSILYTSFIALSRIYLRKHFILDVLGGICIGAILTITGIYLFSLIWS